MQTLADSTRPTIFISAYRNFSVRYILYSDIFKELKRSGARIVLFLHDNDIEYYRERLAGENVIAEPVMYESAFHALRGSRLGMFFILVRKLMSGSEPGFKNSTDEIRVDLYRRGMSGTWKASLQFKVTRLLAGLGNRVPSFRKALVALETRIFPGKFYDPYFKKYRPQMLVVSSLGYMIDPYFMRAATRHGCKVVSVIHNWDNPSTKDYRGSEPDHVVTWNQGMKREVSVFHDIPRERVHVGGIAHWDFYFNGSFHPTSRDEFLHANSLHNDRRVLLYANSAHANYPRSFEVMDRLLEAVAAGRFQEPVQLLVRLHPQYLLKERGKEGQLVDRFQVQIDQMKDRYGSLVSFTTPMMTLLNDDIDMPPEDMHLLANSIHHADVLVTEYSTVMIEAAILDTPVVNAGLFNWRNTELPCSYVENFTHIKSILGVGATRNAYTVDQLCDYISDYLRDPSMERENRKRLVDQMVTANRGRAGQAIGDHLTSLIDDGARRRGAEERAVLAE